MCGTYSARHLTDGFIPDRRVTRLGGNEALARELIEAELWLEAEGGYQYRNWREYQPTRDEVEGKKAQARERQKRKRERDSQGKFAVTNESVTRDKSVSHAPVTGDVTLGVTRPGENAGSTSENEAEPTDSEKTTPVDAVQAKLDELAENQPEPIEQTENLENVTRDNKRDSRESNAVSHTTPVPSRPVPSPNTLSSNVASDADAEDEPEPAEQFSDDVNRLCQHLAGWISSNGNRKPNITKTWKQAIDRLIRIDGYTPDQIGEVIDWSQRDEFWQGNILSAGKLRKQFDQLKNKMLLDRRRGQNNAMAPGSQRALNTLQLGQKLQADHDNQQRQELL